MSGVLVTGGSGYLGSLAVEALVAAGAAPVVSLDLHPPAAGRTGVIDVVGDVRAVTLPEVLEEQDIGAVVHLAAVLDPPPDMDIATLRDIEVGGTARVVAACLDAGVEHLTVASSGAAYGYTPANRERPRRESDPVPGHPRFAYSRHKAEVESLLAAARDEHPELGQLILRPGTILGEGTDNLITRLFTAPVVPGLIDTDVPFQFVHDRDVAAVIARGVAERMNGVFNLAGDGVLTLRDIAAIEGRPFVRLPAGLLAAGLALAQRFGNAPYGPEQVDFVRYRPVLANDAIKAALPDLAWLSTAECYARFRSGRSRRR
ncbi:MAG: NAD-dependent epimerase/dehydratase family protein [Nitriliruptoraceae bacterium]